MPITPINRQTTTNRSPGHSPNLDTIKKVENAIKENSGQFTRYNLWKDVLLKSMMYQTFQTVLEYLAESDKITFDSENKVVWKLKSTIAHFERQHSGSERMNRKTAQPGTEGKLEPVIQ